MGVTSSCDPGITIGQTNPAVTYRGQADTDESLVVLNVKTVNPFISSRDYGPPVTVVNMSDEPIPVTGAKLFSEGISYSKQWGASEMVPADDRPISDGRTTSRVYP